jgi:EAL domain-containing protein (putative c-di-GMP-specific phosphodiesterase class I)/GGDEF domain-containing protein
MFPKTRSWFALGAPLELLSPLSVLRILFALAIVLWPLEGLVFHWPSSKIPWLGAAIVVAAGVWFGLLRVKTVSPRRCHVLAALGTALVATLVYLGHGTATALAMTALLVPFSIFVALYLGGRAVVGHQVLASAALWVALADTLHAGAASVVVVAMTIALLSVSATVRVLMISLWRGGSVDPDTGLPNGVGLAQRLSSRHGADANAVFVMATVQLAGVDDARQALGYQVGTELLRRAVEDLGQVVPSDTVIARVEADELVLTRALVSDPGATTGGAPSPAEDVPLAALAAGQALARDLVGAIATGRYLVDGVEVLLRAHVGLVFSPWDGTDCAELVRRSSLSARRAAATGQSVTEWDGDRDALTPEDLALLADLRLAIDRGELWMAYQPQMSATTGRIVSTEALLRWDNPVHGKVPPGRFIVLAERTGLIDRLTEWVMAQALDAQVRWRRQGIEIPVSVNLSAKTLAWPELPVWVQAQLEERELPPSALTVEVTETAAADLLQAVQLLRPLHQRGIRISIDDFGMGYTSLAAIPYLPLDEIKVDMEFVRRSTTSSADEAIVRCVHELAHRLGLVTVAEGVEDGAIQQLMVEIGFDLLQGFHLARPMSEQQFLDVVRGEHLVSSGTAPADHGVASVAP